MTTLKSQKGKLPVLTASRPASDTIEVLAPRQSLRVSTASWLARCEASL